MKTDVDSNTNTYISRGGGELYPKESTVSVNAVGGGPQILDGAPEVSRHKGVGCSSSPREQGEECEGAKSHSVWRAAREQVVLACFIRHIPGVDFVGRVIIVKVPSKAR